MTTGAEGAPRTMPRHDPAAPQPPVPRRQPPAPNLQPYAPRRAPPKQLKDPPPEKYSVEWYVLRAKETERSKAAPDTKRARQACGSAVLLVWPPGTQGLGTRLLLALRRGASVNQSPVAACAEVAHVSPSHLQAGGSVAALALLTAASAAAYVLF